MKKKLKNTILFVLLLALVFHLSPVPKLVEKQVLVHPDPEIRYMEQDGSFMIWYVAGCLPWLSCRLNEPTDWWISLR